MADDDVQQPRSSWPYGVALPHRYSSHYEQYQALGGLVDVADDARAYAGPEPLRDVERFLALSLAFDQIHKEGVAGDFAELGVYKGDTAAVLARHARRLGRTLWLLDTFEGFDERDFTGLDAGRASGFSDTSLEAVSQRVGLENTIYIDGYFPETASRLPDDRTYCLVNIDTDLYAPIKSGLEYFYPRMEPGGFIFVHDYGSLAWAGVEKAVDEFFADKPECVVSIPDGAGSVVIRRQRPTGGGVNWLAARQVVPVDQWLSLAKGQSTQVLLDGWSTPEDWGVWGVGAAHQIRIATAPRGDGAMILECEVWAYLPGNGLDRTFDVVVDGKVTEKWRFSPDENRAVRSLNLPGGVASHTVEFRPRSVVSPRDIDPSHQDGRPLGLALSQFRVKHGG
jgi:hypothetical protein